MGRNFVKGCYFVIFYENELFVNFGLLLYFDGIEGNIDIFGGLG